MDHSTRAKDDVLHDFHIGDSVVANTIPTVEGLVIDIRKREDGKSELLLLIAPFHKKGYPWTKAAVCYREPAKLSKKSAATCMFSIPNGDKWKEEAKKAQACPLWITAALDEINSKIPRSVAPVPNGVEAPTTGIQTSAEATALLAASPTGTQSPEIEELAQRVRDILHFTPGPSTRLHNKHSSASSDSSSAGDTLTRRPRKKKHSRKRREHSSSSSTPTSSSSSEDSVAPGEVSEKRKSGMFTCPFASSDSRGFKDVKIVVKGQAISRKHIRTALHNLYAENYSLSAFVNTIITTANASTFKPYPSDVAWLSMHAKFLDGVLLNALNGPWSLWNEAWLDDIAAAFLELIVRVSANKEYPSCLDDKVRKWMKKRRVGVNTKYGPVTAGMQQAKITENGLQFFQGFKPGSTEVKPTKSPFNNPVAKPGGVSPPDTKSK